MSQWADHFVRRSEVREAAGIFLVFIRDEENGFFKFVVMEFLKCDGGGNGGENRDVWRDKFAFLLHCSIELIYTHTQSQLQDDTHVPSLTGKPGGSFIWTNSRSLLKCLNGATTSSTFSNLSRKKPWVSCFLLLRLPEFQLLDLLSVRNGLGSFYYSLLV